MKLLVIDETSKVQTKLDTHFKTLGLKVRYLTTVTGNEELISKWRPYVVLLHKADPSSEIKKIRALTKIPNCHVIALASVYDANFFRRNFESGADDVYPLYIEADVIAKKLDALFRKVQPLVLDRFGICLEREYSTMTIENKSVSLTKTQFNLVYELLKSYPNPAPRAELLNAATSGVVTEKTLDVHVCALRKILKPFEIDIACKRSYGFYLESTQPQINAS